MKKIYLVTCFVLSIAIVPQAFAVSPLSPRQKVILGSSVAVLLATSILAVGIAYGIVFVADGPKEITEKAVCDVGINPKLYCCSYTDSKPADPYEKVLKNCTAAAGRVEPIMDIDNKTCSGRTLECAAAQLNADPLVYRPAMETIGDGKFNGGIALIGISACTFIGVMACFASCLSGLALPREVAAGTPFKGEQPSTTEL